MGVGIFIAKYSYEFKKKIIPEYINGNGGYNYLANKHGVPSDTTVKKWVDNYKEFGDEALKRSKILSA